MSSFLAGFSHLFDKDKERQPQLLALAATVVVILGALVPFIGPWRSLAVLVGLTVFGLTMWKPEIGISILAVLYPLEPFLLKFVPDDSYVYARFFSELLVYVLFGAALLRVIIKRQRPVTPLDLPFLFFLLTVLASWALNAVPLGIGALGVRQIIRFILVFFALVWLRPESRFIKRLLMVMFGLVAFEAILGLTQSLAGGALDPFLIPSERRFFESIQLTTGTDQFWSPGSRIFATMGRYDQLGTFLSFFLLLAVGLLYALKQDNRWRRSLQFGLVVGLPALMLTMSRASWFGFLIGFVAIGAVLMKDRRVRYGMAAAAIAAVGYLAYTGLVVRYLTEYPSQTTVERFFEAFSYERWRGEYYGLGRLYWMVQTPKVVVRASPVLGHGPGMYGGGAAAALGNTRVYEKLNLPYGVYGSEGYIDNNWFSIWGEAGTLGLIFYAMMLWMLARISLRLWRATERPWIKGLALGYFGAVLAVSFQALLATYLEVRTLAFYLWAFGAFVVVLAEREKVLRLK
jgi:hypothetical protein